MRLNEVNNRDVNVETVLSNDTQFLVGKSKHCSEFTLNAFLNQFSEQNLAFQINSLISYVGGLTVRSGLMSQMVQKQIKYQ